MTDGQRKKSNIWLREENKVLVSTDTASEGLNLQTLGSLLVLETRRD